MLCEENRCLIEPELMEELNLQGSTLGWQAGNYSEFWGRTLREGVELRLGTLNPSQSVSVLESLLRSGLSNQKSVHKLSHIKHLLNIFLDSESL